MRKFITMAVAIAAIAKRVSLGLSEVPQSQGFEAFYISLDS
ncbi:hypothetical protein [Nostoc edaphicum]|nr:hypothetical protein [Nostoc edaphicum]